MDSSASSRMTTSASSPVFTEASPPSSSSSPQSKDSSNNPRLQKLNYLLQQSEIYSGIIGQKMAKERESKQNQDAKAKAKLSAESSSAKPPQPTTSLRTSTRSSNDNPQERVYDGNATKKPSKQSSRKRKGGLITDFMTEEDLRAQAKHAKKAHEATNTADDNHLQPDPSSRQPATVSGAQLRPYQLVGMEWLVTLYENGLNGILADEMGLGKTLQTIAFLAYLRERGVWGPFLIVCPLSTIANWVAEFERFTPSIPVVQYHGNPQERTVIRDKEFKLNKASKPEKNFPVVVTTYELIMNDKKHLSRMPWKYVVVDESHRLKNMNCKLLKELRTYSSANRLLLTGTPLQNNLTELWSLLNYILPDIFGSLEDFQSWFDFSDLDTTQGNDRVITEEQSNKIVTKLHSILKPFLLRRLKQDVESLLPPKKEYMLSAPLTAPQKDLYDAVVNRKIRKFLFDKMASGASTPDTSSVQSSAFSSALSSPAPSEHEEQNPKSRESRSLASSTRSSGRRSSRKRYAEQSDSAWERDLENGNLENYNTQTDPPVDLNALGLHFQSEGAKKSVNALKLQNLLMQLRKVCNHPWLFDWPTDETTGDLLVNEDIVNASGKTLLLNRLLPKLFENDHKVLIYSQFTSMLDILEEWATRYKKWPVCRIDGSTKQEDRTAQMKEFNNNTGPNSCKLFLLSTRSGGIGINLTAADTVILFDSDWNPQMDLQAMDRVHRIGQSKPVLVFRLVTANTAESKILQRAGAKRKLEALVIGEGKFGLPGQDTRDILGTKNSSHGKNSTVTEMAQVLLRREEEDVSVADKNDVILSDEQLETLLDRSDAAMGRSAGWATGTGGKDSAAVQVFESNLTSIAKEQANEEQKTED